MNLIVINDKYIINNVIIIYSIMDNLDLDINNEDKNYYTFFAKNELDIVFKKIFN